GVGTAGRPRVVRGRLLAGHGRGRLRGRRPVGAAAGLVPGLAGARLPARLDGLPHALRRLGGRPRVRLGAAQARGGGAGVAHARPPAHRAYRLEGRGPALALAGVGWLPLGPPAAALPTGRRAAAATPPAR